MEERTSVQQPPQLPGPWGAGSRRKGVWHFEQGSAVGRCAECPEGANLPGISAGRDPFWAVLEASRFSGPEAAAQKHKRTAVSRDAAVTSATSADVLKTNSLEAFGTLAGILWLSAQQLSDGCGRPKHWTQGQLFQEKVPFFPPASP